MLSTESDLPLTVYWHGAADCASGTWRSATVTDAWRASGSAFSATLYATVPSPCPSAVDVKVIHDAETEARHEHSRAIPIDKVPDPPAAGNDPLLLEIVASHRPDAGDVTFVAVDAELPQPIAVRASARNSRDVRECTEVAKCTTLAMKHEYLEVAVARHDAYNASGQRLRMLQ